MHQPTSLTDRPTRGRSRARKALLAVVASGLLLALGAAPATAVPVDGEAFGISADVTVTGPAGIEIVSANIPPTPSVTCPPDAADEVASAGVPTVISTGVLNAECTTTDDVLSASASVADLNLLDQVTANLVTAECSANGGVSGSSELVDAVLLGEPLEVAPDPNTVIDLPGLGTVTLNRQTVTTDDAGNETIVVEAIVIEIDAMLPAVGPPPPGLEDLIAALPPELAILFLPGSSITAEVIVASVTCTAAPDDMVTTPPTPSSGSTPTTDDGGTGTTAPPPPVGELPRTGGGSSTGTFVGLGVALLAAGALSLAASRRARGAHTA